MLVKSSRPFLTDLFFTTRHQGGLLLKIITLLLLSLVSLPALANEKPVIISTPTTVVEEDSFYTYLLRANDADGDLLTYSAPQLPSWLAFNTSTATLSGVPLNGDVGTHTVTLRVSDGIASSEQLYTISVNNINDQPTVISNIPNLVLIEDIDFELDLTDHFEDIDVGDLLIFSADNLPTGLALSPTGQITGAPTNDDAFDSPFNVTITASDLAKTRASSLFQIIVVNINDAPTPQPDTGILSEDSDIIIDVLKNDIDVDDVLLPSSVVVITQPLHGEASVNTSNGLITYVPNPDYDGEDSLEYRITDPLGAPGTAIVSITVLPVNDAPVAHNDVVLTSEDTRIDIDVLANDTDPDIGDAPQGSQLVIQSPPSNGTVEIHLGQIRYTPDENFNGTDNLQYKAADLNGVFTNTATVTISVGAINDIPVAGDDIANTLEDTAVEFVVINNDSDIEDGAIDPATIFVVNAPLHGTIALNTSGTMTYTPDPDFNGSDSLEYTVKDSKGLTSSAATVTLTINPVNDTPIANNDLVSLNEDTTLEINILGNDTDVDGNETINVASIAITTDPSHGSLFINTVDGIVQYTPQVDFFGSDTFNYTVTDKGGLTSSPAQVLLTIASVNDSPRLTDDSAITDEDNAVTIVIIPNDTDVDGILDLTTLEFIQQPAHGTATFNSLGEIVYTPTLNFHGNDLLSYTIKDNDGLVSAEAASVLLTINSINDAPTANANSYTVREDKPLEIVLTGSDIDGDTLDFLVTLQPRHGVLSGSGANLTYLPDQDYNGPDNLNFQSTDGKLNSGTVNVAITVLPINDRPVATPQTISVNEDGSVSFVLTGTDIDEDELTFELAGGDLGGIITGSAPNITYHPAENFNGEERLLFLANDSELDSGVEVITINVLAVNDIPTVESQDLFLAEDSTVNVTLLAADIDGDTLTYLIEEQPANGTLSGVGRNLIYAPDANYFGPDSFTFKVNDGSISSPIGTVSLTISPNSDPPAANSQTVIGNEDSEIVITLTGSDPDGNNLIYQIIATPTQGTIDGTPPNLTYLANENFNGQDSLMFKVSDGNLESQNAVVTITVNPVNDAPVAHDDVYNLSMENKQWLTLDVLNNDEDLDDDELSLLSAQVDFGSVAINDNHLRYVPEPDFAGNVLIQYLIADPSGQSDTATVQLKVIGNTSPNAPHITPPDEINVIASGTVTKVNLGTATAVDTLGNVIGVSLLSRNDNFKPGAHTVFWKATDSQGNSAIASQKVNVYPLVFLTAGQQVEEGDEVTIKARLNGPAPIYPIVVPYTVQGSATGGIDYELTDGEIRFDQGTEVELSFITFTDEDDEPAEDIIIVLGDTPNKSRQSIHRVSLIENNIAPRIMLHVMQDEQQRFLLEQTGGTVSVSAQINDVNSADSHTIEWQPGEGVVRANQPQLPLDSHFMFSVQDMAPGIYRLAATVADDAEPSLSGQTQLFIEVVEVLPELGNDDSDGDLLSDASEGFADLDNDHIADFMDPIDDCNLVPEQADDTQRFLVEGQVGGCLRRGALSAQSNSNGLMLMLPADGTEEESLLPIDPDTINVGGLFDFEIHNIQTNDEPYFLVIPQRQPISADAVYRKYSKERGWYTFLEDDNNSVWSTQGSAGICPPPKDSRWQRGLQVGHWCVQLAIEDGGANDDDGQVNHSIVDPGGVAVYNSSNNFPVAEPDTAIVNWNSSSEIEVLDNDSDEDDDSLVIISAGAQLGFAEVVDEQWISYEALENFVGEDVVNYSISDGHGGIASSTLTITVKGNSAPHAVDDTASTLNTNEVIVDVLFNDTDNDDDELNITDASVNSGAVTITGDNKLKYTPVADFEGTVTVTYQIKDPSGATDEGQLFIVISSPSAPPPPPVTTPPSNNDDSGGGPLPVELIMLLSLLVLMRRKW